MAALVVAVDQLTKWWALEALDDQDIDLVWTLRLHLVHNTGAAFGLGQELDTVIAVVALVFVAVVAWASWGGRRLSLPPVLLGMVQGGAVGNLADRAVRAGDGVSGRGRGRLRRPPVVAGVQCGRLRHCGGWDCPSAVRSPLPANPSPPTSPMSADIAVPDALVGERIDRVVTLVWGCSRAEAARLIDQQKVAVNGIPATGRSQRLAAGDQITLSEEPVVGRPVPVPDPSVELDVVHVDEQVIVVNKPAELVVHPGSGNAAGTMVNGLLARFPEIAGVGEPERPGIVHRLDRGTSGLLMVARTQPTYEALTAALSRREVHRGYVALVAGMPADDRGVIDAPVGRSPRHPTKMAVTADGRPAQTHYQVTARMSARTEPPDESVPFDSARLELQLETGRTHQIRVHLAAIGHPVLGDELYGGPVAPGISHPALHAHTLAFDHPETDEHLRFEADLPEDFSRLYRLLCP